MSAPAPVKFVVKHLPEIAVAVTGLVALLGGNPLYTVSVAAGGVVYLLGFKFRELIQDNFLSTR